jgi:hypothetical protein
MGRFFFDIGTSIVRRNFPEPMPVMTIIHLAIRFTTAGIQMMKIFVASPAVID